MKNLKFQINSIQAKERMILDTTINAPVKLRNMIYKTLIKSNIMKHYGHAVVSVFDKDGRFKYAGDGFNTVVIDGRGALGDLMIGASVNTINAMNVGMSDQAPSDTDIDLILPATPIERMPIADGGRLRSNLTLSFSALVPSTKYDRPLTIREIGVYFEPVDTGKLFARAVITPVMLDTGDTARVDYEVQL